MARRSREFVVKGNRIRVRCERCKKIRYHYVPKQVRRKVVRCSCGKSVNCIMNRRMKRRELCTLQAKLIVSSHLDRSIKVRMCDISETGVGFIFSGQSANGIVSSGKKCSIQYRMLSGRSSVRKIQVASISVNRVGAFFIDIPRL